MGLLVVCAWDACCATPYVRCHHYVYRYTLFASSLAFGLAYIWGIFYGLPTIAATATLWVFVVPFLLVSFLLMFGNWSQHVFINDKCARSNYGHTYNCVNHFENQTTFNDGYHIVHHVNSKLHWSEMPNSFLQNLHKYVEHDAIVFEVRKKVQVGVIEVMDRIYEELSCRVSTSSKSG